MIELRVNLRVKLTGGGLQADASILEGSRVVDIPFHCFEVTNQFVGLSYRPLLIIGCEFCVVVIIFCLLLKGSSIAPYY